MHLEAHLEALSIGMTFCHKTIRHALQARDEVQAGLVLEAAEAQLPVAAAPGCEQLAQLADGQRVVGTRAHANDARAAQRAHLQAHSTHARCFGQHQWLGLRQCHCLRSTHGFYEPRSTAGKAVLPATFPSHDICGIVRTCVMPLAVEACSDCGP